MSGCAIEEEDNQIRKRREKIMKMIIIKASQDKLRKKENKIKNLQITVENVKRWRGK